MFDGRLKFFHNKKSKHFHFKILNLVQSCAQQLILKVRTLACKRVPSYHQLSELVVGSWRARCWKTKLTDFFFLTIGLSTLRKRFNMKSSKSRRCQTSSGQPKTTCSKLLYPFLVIFCAIFFKVSSSKFRITLNFSSDLS